MKKIITLLLLFNLNTQEQIFSQATVSVDFNTFYTTLSPYGRWVDYPQYGKIWICNEPAFRPYYNDGHWEYTVDGWAWVSDYPWGWAPFHYGRWAFVDGYGWAWVPGYEWAPAWVSWSNNDDYYGWAPLSPGLSINVSIGNIPPERWCFVPHRYINSPSVRNYYVDNSRNVTIIKNVTVINNTHVTRNVRYVSGPSRADVERRTNVKIQPRRIANASRPGKVTVTNNTVNIYRPSVKRNTPATNTPVAANRNNKPTTNSTIRRQTPWNITVQNNNNHPPAKKQIQQKVIPTLQNNQPKSQRLPQQNTPIQNQNRNVQPQQRVINKPPANTPQPQREISPRQIKPQVMPNQMPQRVTPQALPPNNGAGGRNHERGR